MNAIEVEDLRKSYGGHEALRGVSFTIREGEVFGLLGPNGAGKTTTVEVLEGYRARDGELVSVRTAEPARAVAELYAREGELPGLEVRRATLEEIYLALTEEEAAPE